MKIGILTLPLHTNYGGILQAYALQTVLERMGHEVEIFNRKASFKMLPIYKRPLYYGGRLLKKVFIDSRTVIRREYIIKKEYPIVSQYTQRFIDKYIHCCWIDDLTEINGEKFDMIVVGSDQIWRPRYFTKMWSKNLTNAFLSFANSWNIKRYAYAASFGVDEWEYPDDISECLRKAVSQFDAISVREKIGVDLCEKYLHQTAVLVLDPTILLCKEDYIQLIENANQPKSEGSLFCYILDSSLEKDGLVTRIAREKKLNPFHIKAESLSRTNSVNERIHKPVEAWLRGFYDAEFVITDSFHACVFSILFGKPFIAVGNKDRGLSRFSSLLEMFSLKHNLICNMSEYDPNRDYSVPKGTYSLLDKLRSQSISFLKQINNK